MKLKQRLLLFLLSVIGLGGLLTVLVIELTTERNSYKVRSPRRLPRVRHLNYRAGLPRRQQTTSIVPADSDKAEEVTMLVNETLYLKNIGKSQFKPKRRWKSDSNKAIVKLQKPFNETTSTVFTDFLRKSEYPDLVRVLRNQDKRKSPKQNLEMSIKEILGIQVQKNMTSMEEFYLKIRERHLYQKEDPVVEKVLRDMANMPIVNVVEKEGGTQLKLLLTFEDGSQAMMKPMRFDRLKETEPNHFYFVDYERHVSEIAAFHLDRILDFRRTPPTVGRLLNITSEIYAQADDDLIRTFFISPARNLCFHGRCSYYCDTAHAICGRPETLEGSLSMILPPKTLSSRKSWKNPWRRSYHKRRKAEWEVNDDYCDDVRMRPPYDAPRRLADVIDMAILDFLIGNMDRHHYETFQLFGNDSFIVHLDHGRGFGRSDHDEVSILAPLYQCCFLRFSTFQRLLELHRGKKKLSESMRCSLHRDPLDPVLIEKHLRALDRRLVIILEAIRNCLTRYGENEFFFLDD